MAVDLSRRTMTCVALAFPLHGAVGAMIRQRANVLITDLGASGDGSTLNTVAIQSAIDKAATEGGGTVIIPAGTFVTGALFMKPGVHLHFDKGAVLRCSIDVERDFPRRRTRIEGHFEEHFTPGLINADGCDGLRITGEGTLDGAGRPIWDQFWKMRNAAPDPDNFPNLGLARARLAIIENSKNVRIDGVTFKDSQFWNLHLYRCSKVMVRNARFVVPDDYKQAPSTDGIDLDSCQDVTVESCYFSVTDDCVAAKGTKGPAAMQDQDSPPVERILVRNCHFRRGHHALACGSEATIVRNVTVENCRVTGDMVLARLKLRPDTPQIYEDIAFRNITFDSGGGTIVQVLPWTQYFDLKGAAPPQSIVRNLSFTGLRGRYGAFGTISGNPGQTTISSVLVRNVDLTLRKAGLEAVDVTGLRFEKVKINGQDVRR